MYHLLDYSDIYFMTSRSLWNYYKYEINDDANEKSANANNYKTNNNRTTTTNNDKNNKKIMPNIICQLSFCLKMITSKVSKI